MQIIFFGSPLFAIPALKKLHESEHDILAVVTQPDKPKGRKQAITATAVKSFALENELKILTSTDLKSADFMAEYKALRPEINIVVAYGRIMPGWIIGYPEHGTLNAHASLLPRWRGAAPINRAIMEGDKETGITIQYVVEELDAGDIALQMAIAVEENDNYGSVSQKLAELAAKMILEALDLKKKGKLPKKKQDEQKITYAEKISKKDRVLDLNKPAVEIVNRIRGLAPKPGAIATIDGRNLKILKAKKIAAEGEPGQIVGVDKAGVTIGTGDKSVLVEAVQPEGGRLMAAYEYAKGHLK